MPFFEPSKMLRKAKGGTQCPACSLKMHHTEMIGWAGEQGTMFLHPQCAEIILEQTAESVIQEDFSAAAGTENTEQ